MTKRNSLFAALIAALASASGSPAIAADGEILITHAKALAGNVTPGDAPGYPITLSKTGSYRLGGNLIPGAGKNGIEITGDFVTLDFGGFTLNGRNIVEDGIFGGAPKALGSRTARSRISSGMASLVSATCGSLRTWLSPAARTEFFSTLGWRAYFTAPSQTTSTTG